MRKAIILIILFIAFTKINAQTNLVNNGDFELYSGIPLLPAQWNLAIGWNNTNINGGTPEYFHTLCTSLMNDFGAITPVSGNGQMGLCTYSLSINFREYVATFLTSNMNNNQFYIISFYLTNGTGTGIDYQMTSCSNNFGIYFSNNQITQSMTNSINITPQININTIINSFNNWQHFSFAFKPDSNYKYITLGNFKNDSNTILSSFGNGYAYYFIDKVEVYPYKINIIGDTLICQGNSATIKIQNDSIVKWADSLNPNIILATDSIVTVSPLATTTYKLTSAYDTNYFTVHVVNPPIINIGKDTSLCPGQSLLLNANTPYVSYLWQDSTTNSTYTVTHQGTYWVKTSIDSNCFAIDSIHIIYNPNPTVNLGNDTTLCYGENLILNAAQPNASYKWQDNSTNSIFIVKPPYTPYVFWVMVTKNYCSGSDTLQIFTYPLPVIDLGNNTTLCPGQTVLLDVTYPNAIYYWQDGSTLPTYNATQTGIYIVKVTDTTTNCSTTSQIKLVCELDPEIPNVFTPNGDSYNDYFFIKNSEYWNIDLQIFNRWGNIVYQNNTYKNTWDGKDVADGVYYYIIKATNNNSGIFKEYKGSVTVLR